MKQKTIRRYTQGLILALLLPLSSLVLTACGGGGGDDDGSGNTGGNGSGGGTGDGGTGNPSTYIVTPSVSGTGGSISPSVAVTVLPGATATFTLKPNTGYTASVSGTCEGTFSGTTYTTKAITGNCTVVVSFAGQPSYTVTPSVSSTGGTISPATAVTVQSGAATSFQVTPNSGYAATVSGTCGGTLSGTTYTTKAITASCTVVAAFAASNSTGPLAFIYESSQTSPGTGNIFNTNPLDDFMSPIIQEGAKGYFYQGSDLSYPFVNDGTKQTYSYEWLAGRSNRIDGFISVANGEGAKGYSYKGSFWSKTSALTDNTGSSYMLFRKDNGSSATYTYAAAPVPVNTADFLAQANIQGQSGYWFVFGPLDFVLDVISPDGSVISGNGLAYIKNNASNATYTFDILAWPMSPNALLTQLNSQGAKGYRALYSGLSLAPNATVYIKDQTQGATFTYQLVTSVTPPTIDQTNSYGAQGYAYWGSVLLPAAASTGYFYVKANNCQGWLCTAISPAVNVKASPAAAN